MSKESKQDGNIWNCVQKKKLHDALRYKKVNKKKNVTKDNGYLRDNGYLKIAFGVTMLVLLTANNVLAIDQTYPLSEKLVTIELTAGDVQITHSTSKNRQPVWSPDGQWISFITTRSGDWNVYKMKKDGSSVTRLTTDSGFHLEPSWGVNNKILFSKGPAQHYEDIFVMNADGTGQVRLTSDADFDEYPDWNPAATKIIYSSMGGIIGGPKNIWVMNADGSGKHKLNSVFGFQPAWSPDGTKIAFKCYISGSNICIMNADGTNVKQVTFGGYNTHDPDWSPDNKQLVYASKRTTTDDWEIYAINADGSNVRQLTNNGVEDNYPAWSPDGKSIIFSSTRTGNDEIWSMNAPGVSLPTAGIDISVPAGGEVWTKGSTYNIVWSSYGMTCPSVKIELLKGGVVNSIIASSAPNSGSYSWKIPLTQTNGADYKIRVTSTINSMHTDTSSNNFVIGDSIIPSPTSITVDAPNGGEKWIIGSTHEIKWTYTGNPGSYVRIELLKGGTVNRVLATNTVNDKSFWWPIPLTVVPGGDYKIRVISTSNSVYTDTSNGNFILG